jgi:predicted transcriptional regulator of viral defense system
VFQREQGVGETSVRVDVEEIERTALTYFDPDDTNLAANQREIRAAVTRLAKEGLVEEESEGRYRVTPLVEVVLSNERLGELREWLGQATTQAVAR